MSNILLCKLCEKEMDVKQFGHHIFKNHNQKYKDYVLQHLEDFKHLNWKLCSECNILFRGTSLKCGSCYTKNHKIKTDQFIQCHYCNIPIHSKVISIHLKSHHNIEFLDYVKNHIDDFKKMGWCNCIICGNVAKKRGNKHETTCSERCLSEYRKTLIGEKSSRFGAILSEETKQKIRIGNSGKEGLKGDLNPACRPEVRKLISKTRVDRGVAKGEKNPMFGKTHTPEAIKKIFSHRKMNKLEKMVSDELDKAGIPYYFQFFIIEGNLCKSYDFKIKGKPLIIETDGDFWHGNPAQKNHYEKAPEVRENDALKDEMAARRGYTVIRLWERDIKKDPSIVLKYVSG
jgi:DNA-directed RNA polymerase subunit RPC12/RpoP